MIDTTSIAVGFRFHPTQHRILTRYANEFEQQKRTHELVTIFRQAALAASTGEPVIWHCTSLDEARTMQALFTFWPGVQAPTLDELHT